MSENQAICTQCRNQVRASDWTCPKCGAILDKYLFSTVNLKSLPAEGRAAYNAGYKDCIAYGSGEILPGLYRPTPGQETAYRAGWQAAADKAGAKADRKFGRRRGLKVMGSGFGLLLLGAAIAYGTGVLSGGRISFIVITPLALGVMNVVIGFMMILTGDNDEARPA